MTSKDDMRAVARTRRSALAASSPDFAVTIAGEVEALSIPPAWAVASYWPLRDEADPRLLAKALAAHGHAILLPCIAERGERLLFRVWREGDPMRPGAFGIQEPMPTAPEREPRAVFIPLLAFDRSGHRLGYGGGYYDRTLQVLRARHNVLAIGIAYADQELDRLLPAGAHDEKLDMIVTENGVCRF